MTEYNLAQTIDCLSGPTKEQMTVNNQWAAVALNKFHENSFANLKVSINGKKIDIPLKWDSNFSSSAMKENIDAANHGGVAMAFFLMSVILEYRYVEQSEIGEGVDYRFKKELPDMDDLNFLDDFHYVEVSGILRESPSNTLPGRIKVKHNQIDKGSKRDEKSSVVVTLFSDPITVKEKHK